MTPKPLLLILCLAAALSVPSWAEETYRTYNDIKVSLVEIPLKTCPETSKGDLLLLEGLVPDKTDTFHPVNPMLHSQIELDLGNGAQPPLARGYAQTLVVTEQMGPTAHPRPLMHMFFAIFPTERAAVVLFQLLPKTWSAITAVPIPRDQAQKLLIDDGMVAGDIYYARKGRVVFVLQDYECNMSKPLIPTIAHKIKVAELDKPPKK